MPEKGVSTLVAMILVLAIVSTSITAIASNYLPILKKRAEIQHEEELTSSFLEIASVYPGNETVVLKLGGGTTLLNPTPTSSSVHLWKSGSVEVDVNNAQYNTTLFTINLSTFNTCIPDRVLLFSEGGVKIYQNSRNITAKPPDIRIYYNANSLHITLDNLTSDEQEVAGSGIAYIAVHSQSRVYSFTNVNVTLTVDDAIFEEYWVNTMKYAGFTVSSMGNTATGGKKNVNLTLEIRDFDIRLH